MAYYVDTSALVKLIVAETETTALRRWLTKADQVLVTSDLSRTELMRAVRRAAPDRAPRVREVLDAFTLTQLTPAAFSEAGRLDPLGLRPLDALHLASALNLDDDLEGIVTYDHRMADAATTNGIAVLAPR
ncbi:MAG TPA: type II toxin-antitoxin system VapC family toxin [Microthrixaceae bacterium]|nr:type II toxin-antitoxin system VapC family toxin [Microthrixaceae bacterium]HNI35072.1 type II toxin-antitoxin system VapC family toxin [Microthrixaceae bacterium]